MLVERAFSEHLPFCCALDAVSAHTVERTPGNTWGGFLNSSSPRTTVG
jgi:hypothetical protein